MAATMRYNIGGDINALLSALQYIVDLRPIGILLWGAHGRHLLKPIGGWCVPVKPEKR